MKLLKIAIASLMILSLTACSNEKSKTDSDGVTTITFWGHQEQSWNDAYISIGKKFEAEYPEYKVDFEFFPYDSFESKVQTSLISQSGGSDIYELWGGWGVDFASTGALAKIPDSLASQIENDVYQPTIGALMYEDHLYGMPLEFNIEMGGLLVNDTILNENGYQIPTTWDELIATAQEATVMTDGFYDIKGFDFVNWDSLTYLYTSMILSQGGQYLTDEGKIDFTNDLAYDAMDVLVSLVNEKKITDMEGLVGGGDLEGYQQLYANQALFVPRGPWVIAEGIQSFELEYGKDFEYVALPFYGDEKKFAAETGWAMAVNGNSSVQEGAFKFIEFMFEDDNIREVNLACGQIPAKKSVATSSEYNSKVEYANILVDLLPNAEFIGYFNTDQFKETINDTFVAYVNGDFANAEEACTDLENKLNESLFN